LSRVSVYSSVV